MTKAATADTWGYAPRERSPGTDKRLAQAAAAVMRHRDWPVGNTPAEATVIVARSRDGFSASIGAADLDSCRRVAAMVLAAANDADPVNAGRVGLLFRDGRMAVVGPREITALSRAEGRLRVLRETDDGVVDIHYVAGRVARVVAPNGSVDFTGEDHADLDAAPAP